MDIRKFLYTEDEFVFEIDATKFKSVLSKEDFPKFSSKFENGIYVIESKISFGVLIINGFKGFGISTNAKVSGDNKRTIVNLNSSFRPEYLFISFGFILFMIVGILKNFGLDILWIIALFVIVFFWFRMILQSQEETLHQNIKNYFKNLDVE